MKHFPHCLYQLKSFTRYFWTECDSQAVIVKSSDRSAGEKKKSIHDRLKENKEKLGQKSGKDNPQKGVELT